MSKYNSISIYDKTFGVKEKENRLGIITFIKFKTEGFEPIFSNSDFGKCLCIAELKVLFQACSDSENSIHIYYVSYFDWRKLC